MAALGININNMKIGIASDHAGYELKSAIIKELNQQFSLIDYGTESSEKSVDYPDFAKVLCQKLINGEIEKGILICGSGVGISIAANRFKKIRAALCFSPEMAELSRKHNDANVLCLGSRIMDQQTAIKSVQTFLNTKFEAGRHANRVEKLSFEC